MTATLDRPPQAQDDPHHAPWRERILAPLDRARPARFAGWGPTAVVALVAGLLRFVRLDLPAGRIFDEIYYACDAQNLLRYGVEHDSIPGSACEPQNAGAFIVHPPLGKWAISLGMRMFGVNELGWRFMAAVAGTLTVVVLVRVARRMTGSTVLGCLAGLLLALDGLHFVQSRVAMLDVFLVLWTTAALACVVADRDAVRRVLAATPDDALAGTGPRLGPRPWRLAAGVCLGAAVATKWSALYPLAVLLLLAFSWEVGARRTAGVRSPVRATLVRSTPSLLGVFAVLPAGLYLLSWVGWFRSDIGWDRTWAQFNPGPRFLPDALRSLWHYHVEILRFHDQLTSHHPYQSHPAGWLVLARPVSYYYPPGLTRGVHGCAADTCAREVLAIGTPALWWGAVVALVLLVWLWVSRRDWRPAAVLAMVAAAVVPWIRDDLHGRTMFLFYALPAVPFLCLALALVAGWALGDATATPRRRQVAAAGIGLYLSVVVVNFAYLYPILAAQTLPYDAWHSRMWFTSWI